MLIRVPVLFILFPLGFIGLTACTSPPSGAPGSLAAQSVAPRPAADLEARPLSKTEWLEESWMTYRQRFIQADGRVIDWEAAGLSTSEGQAYAMLRAVFIDDPETFAQTLAWAENNLQRQRSGRRTDQLWAWKWGQDPQGNWGILDANFASDADVDAITALILAARRWNRPEYLSLARLKLADLWRLSTVVASGNRRYFLPGPQEAFRQGTRIKLNPSYFAPYALRLFAQVDPGRNWLSLVESSYQVLEQSASLSAVSLPSDWVALDLVTGRFQPLVETSSVQSQYGFDAYRVWWRVAWDATWFQAPEAERYLKEHLSHLQALWRSQQRIPAQIDLQGQALVDYDSTAQYGMLYPAFQLVDPTTAEQIYQQKLQPRYQKGFWDNDTAYYTQNLAWLGLLPAPANALHLVQRP